MVLSFRTFNWLFLFLSAILEVISLYFLIELLYSHCVLGGEYGLAVFPYLYFLPGITVQTIILALYRMCCRTVGLDPIATVFNLVSGILCIILTLIMLFAMLYHCGNEFSDMFYISGGCGLFAGISHLCNGIMCLLFMPQEEANYLKPKCKSKSEKE